MWLIAGGALSAPATSPVEMTLADAMAFANALSDYHGLSVCYALPSCGASVGAAQPTHDIDDVHGACEAPLLHPSCTGYRLLSRQEWRTIASASRALGAGGDTEVIPVESAHDRNTCGEGDACDRSCPALRADPGSHRPNPWGFYDLLGNVFEWVHDSVGGAPHRVQRAFVQGGDRRDPLDITSAIQGIEVDPTMTAGLRFVRRVQTERAPDEVLRSPTAFEQVPTAAPEGDIWGAEP